MHILRVSPLLGVVLLPALVACADVLGPNDLPSGTQDPATFNTKNGAKQAYSRVVSTFQSEFVKFMQVSGALSDEMQDRNVGNTFPNAVSDIKNIDIRTVSEGAQNLLVGDNYTELQRVRGYAADAIGRLRKYDPDAPPALRGEMYALAGYAEIMLADLYCSGVPLSTLDFEADYTYHAGSTTATVYEHALGLLDTAVTLGADSTRVLTLARVGRGRALLALGRYSDAADAVKDVQPGDAYQFSVAWRGVDAVASPAFNLVTVADNEGVNGLPFISSGDPRTTVVANGTNSFHIALWFPAKYGSPTATSVVTVADWVEAALIRAEADLHGTGSSWLTMLNTVRTTGTYTDVDTIVVSVNNTTTPPDTTFRYDTAWVAGTGGVGHLGPLTDPGSDTARVSLLFRERAYWLFATGHRQGDLRRLIRQYDRTQTATYPRGPYTGVGVYGQDVTLPIPEAERTNPLFTGCIDRNA